MKARVKLVEGMQFVGSADSGHGVVMDAAVEIGGSNSGIRPMLVREFPSVYSWLCVLPFTRTTRPTATGACTTLAGSVE